MLRDIGMVRRLAAAAALLTALAAQEPAPDAKEAPQDPAAAARDAIRKWLASDGTSEELQAKTIEAVLKDPKAGLVQLAASDHPPPGDGGFGPDVRPKHLESLAVKVVLEVVRRGHASGMTFVGQYDDLELLQPFVGEVLLGLLLDPPTWYPLTFRWQLVAPIRDLRERLPEAYRVDGIVGIIEDEQEPIGLRRGLAAAMWQWGRKEHAQEFVTQLQRATTEGDGEERVFATLVLADYYNVLRDYDAAARAHRTAQALAKGADLELLPVSWYAAACVEALRGEKERAMAALERCVARLASPDLDPSQKLERKLFEKDPEIALLRADPRFAALVERAFGPADDGKDDPADPDKHGRK